MPQKTLNVCLVQQACGDDRAANLTASIAGIQFWGTSFIVGPQGEWLASAPSDEPATLAVELDLDRCERVRRLWPYLRDR